MMISGYIKHLRTALTALAALPLLAGCASDPDAPTPPVDPADNPNEVTLCLNVAFPGATASRADENDPDYYEPASGVFEQIRSLRVIIINNLDPDNNTGFVEANRLVMTDEQGNPMYDNLNFKVQADMMKRIYLIANEEFLTAPEGVSGTASKFLDGFKIDDENRINLSSLAAWTVALPIEPGATTVSRGLFSPPANPTSAVNTRLPLTETFDLYIDRNTAVDETCKANLFMTRAAAKASFLLTAGDSFAQTEGTTSTRITAISISGIGTSEYVFPNNTEYSPSKYIKPDGKNYNIVNPVENNYRYITEFSAPADSRFVTYLINQLSLAITPSDKRPINSLPIYFPESILESGKQYIVSVQLDNDTWLSAPLETNILNINGHDAIARDTYLKIEIVFNSSEQITVNVLPWDREDYYVDYTANIGFTNDGYLNFPALSGSQTQNGLFLDKTAAQLVIDYGKEVDGEFFIASPVGAQWDAYLITTGGATDAIQFIVNDPEHSGQYIYTTHISGKVGVDKASFSITGTVNPGTTQNTAQLLVIVTLLDGTPVIANVIEGWETDQQRLTIISQ